MGDLKDGDEIVCPICGNHFVIGEDLRYVFMGSFVCTKLCFDKAMERYEGKEDKDVNKL